MYADYAGLVEAAIARDIQSRFSVDFFNPELANNGAENLVVIEDFSTGGAIIDQAMRIVISGWSSAIEKNRPSISKATADGELDFWKKFDETQTSFTKIYLDSPVPLSTNTRLNTYVKPVFETYDGIIRGADFTRSQMPVPDDIQRLKALLYETNKTGQFIETKAYALYKKLLQEAHDAMMALNSPDLKKNSPEHTIAQARLTQAQTDLNIRGQKSLFASAEKTLLNFENSSSSMDEQQKLIERFEASEWDSIAEPGIKYPHTGLQNPGIFNSTLDSGAWIKVSLRNETLKDEGIIDIAAQLERNVDGIRQALEDIDHLEFYYQVFGINRAWLDWNLWTEEYWQSNTVISDGKGGGELPAIASKLIVVPAFHVMKPTADTQIVFQGQPQPIERRVVMMNTQRVKIDPDMQAFEELARKKGIWGKKSSALPQTQKRVTRALVNPEMGQAIQARPIAHMPVSGPAPVQSSKANNVKSKPRNTQKSSRTSRNEIAAQVGVAATGLLFNWVKNRRNRKDKNLLIRYNIHSHEPSRDIAVKLEHMQTGTVTPLLTHKGTFHSVGKQSLKLLYGTYTIVTHIQDREISRETFSFERESPSEAALTINLSNEAVYSSSGDQDSFDMMRVFGYLAKSLPKCPI